MPKRSSINVGSSNAARIIQCPGSRELEMQMPEAENQYTGAGKLLHSAMEHWVQHNEWPGHLAFTEEQYRTKLKPAAEAFIALEEAYDPEEILVEQKFALEKIPGAFGRMDVVMICKDRIAVIDWKFGDGVIVSAQNNKQLMYGAWGVMSELGLSGKKLSLIIIQPARDKLQVDVFEATQKDIVKFAADLVEAVGQTNLNRGPECRFCKANAICPLMSANLSQFKSVVYGEVEQDRGPSEFSANLTDEELNDYLQDADYMKTWFAALHAEAVSRIEKGRELPDWKLVQKRASRQWEDEDEAEAYFRKKKVRVRDMFEKKFKSPAGMEKVVGKKRMPSDLVTKNSSGVTLVPADDPRKGLSFSDITSTLKESSIERAS